MLNSEQEIQAKYEFSVAEVQESIAVLKKKIDLFSLMRVALLVVEVALFVSFVSVADDFVSQLIGMASVLPIVIFVVVVNKQNIITKRETYLKNLLWIYQNELNLKMGRDNGYDYGSAFEDENHPYSSDLDVFGKSSLFALTNRCTTKKGNSELAASFSAESTKEKILARQVAVQEISEQMDRTFDFRANLKGHDVSKIEQIKYKLKEQLASQLRFSQGRGLRIYVKVVPTLTIVLLLAAALLGGKLWGILSIVALINAAVIFYHTKSINQVYYGFSGSALLLSDYAMAIKWTEEGAWKSKYIRDLFETSDNVSSEIKKLAKIIQAFDARLNILLGAVLNFFLLWDLRCCIQLGRWHTDAAAKVECALDRIGSFEELISIATLSYNQPHWVFPEIGDMFCLSAKSLGHPLIPADKRVNNDFFVDDSTTVDIVTGSNMAGKSTFLRTIGVNMVLAYAGAPVCATEMRLSIFKLASYMRIKDSLNESTSTFKAELNRLKMILNNVTIHSNSFVLIDEMLRGTNSKDKFMGSKAFIEKLITLGTPSLFATHDLALSELQETNLSAVRNFHFDIQINEGEMNFDYKIKDGPCTIFNAALLLKEIGLSLPS